MANTIKKAERAAIMAFARKLIEAGTPAPVDALITQTGISRERARLALAKTELIMRGERVKDPGRPGLSSEPSEVFTIRVNLEQKEFLMQQGQEAVRAKINEWMHEKPRQ